MVDRAMTTSRAVTKKKEPRFRTFQAWAAENNQRQQQRSLRNDARCRFGPQSKHGECRLRGLVSLHRDLRKLQAETAEPRWCAASRESIATSGGMSFTHALGGLPFPRAPLAQKGESLLPSPTPTLSLLGKPIGVTEADAALSLVRLSAVGDLEKVRLCEVCRERWLAATHRNYRFCSKECRERFYETQPDYHQRKAKNQRKYRVNLQLKQAAEDAVLSKRRKK